MVERYFLKTVIVLIGCVLLSVGSSQAQQDQKKTLGSPPAPNQEIGNIKENPELTSRTADLELQGIGAELTVRTSNGKVLQELNVDVLNKGPEMVDNLKVDCEMTISNNNKLQLSAKKTNLKSGTVSSFKVQKEGTWIPLPGKYPTTCKVSIISSLTITDGNSANDTKTGDVERKKRPDLQAESIELSDCANGGYALIGKKACLSFGYRSSSEEWVSLPWKGDCTIGGKTYTKDGYAPQKNNVRALSFDVGILAEGTYQVNCRLDTTAAITELDEGNNNLTASVKVLKSLADLKYDITPARVAAYPSQQMAFTDQTLHEGAYYIATVWLFNQGEEPIKQAAASCHLESSTLGNFEFNEYTHAMNIAPNETQTSIVYSKKPYYQIPNGTYKMVCEARIVQPNGVTQTSTMNDTLKMTMTVSGGPN